MRNKLLLLLLLMFMTSGMMYAQQQKTQQSQQRTAAPSYTLKGVLLDSLTQEGEPYATIKIAKKNAPQKALKMAVTDLNGKFQEKLTVAPGEVITSICLMVLAGILLSTSFGLLLIILLGLPFTWILKLLLPFTLMLSSPSTVTNGTLRSISITVLVFESGSSSMLYSILSTSTFTSGF